MALLRTGIWTTQKRTQVSDRGLPWSCRQILLNCLGRRRKKPGPGQGFKESSLIALSRSLLMVRAV